MSFSLKGFRLTRLWITLALQELRHPSRLPPFSRVRAVIRTSRPAVPSQSPGQALHGKKVLDCALRSSSLFALRGEARWVLTTRLGDGHDRFRRHSCSECTDVIP